MLMEGRVSPENGAWGDNFAFKVTYTDNENDLPLTGYPKVHINGQSENMIENDPTDNDVTNGKLYEYVWTTSKTDVGDHSFYFYVEDNQGENARNPENDVYDGPKVGKKAVSITFELDDSDPNLGENVTFSGFLKTVSDNEGIAGENVILYEVLSDNTIKARSSVLTDENGNYVMSLNIPSKGIGAYLLKFPGSQYYEGAKTSRSYVNSIDKPLVLGVSILLITIVVLVVFFLLSRGVPKEQFIKPLLIAFAVGVLLQFIGAGFIALIAAGGIAGYLFSKRTGKWTEHLRIGIMAGVLLVLVYDIVFSAIFVTAPGLFGLKYSITQGDAFSIIFTQTIYFLAFFNLLTGIGAILGGMIRGSSKPGE